MREVPGDQHIVGLARQSIADPLGGVVGLQITRGGKSRERIARAPVRLGGLPRAQLAAVPDDRGSRAAPRRFGGEGGDVVFTAGRQRAAGVDLRPDRLTVMG